MDCLFCKIINKEIPSSIVYEDDKILAFNDINPQAPVHILIVPKIHIDKLEEIKFGHREITGYIFEKIPMLITKLNLAGEGVRLVCNNNSQAGQSVFHLHFHLMGGRYFQWPPG